MITLTLGLLVSMVVASGANQKDLSRPSFAACYGKSTFCERVKCARSLEKELGRDLSLLENGWIDDILKYNLDAADNCKETVNARRKKSAKSEISPVGLMDRDTLWKKFFVDMGA